MVWSLPSGEPRAPRARGEPGPGPPRVVVVALLALAVVGAALSGPWETTESPPLPPPMLLDEPEEPPLAVPEEEPESPLDGFENLPEPPIDLGWIWSVVLVLAMVAVGTAIAQALRRRVRRGARVDALPGEPGGEPVREGVDLGPAQLREAVDDAVERLEAEVAPTDAIVAAWVALEEAAARSGVHRDPADTPTEFTVEVLDRAHADPAAVRSLLGLYLRARFSDEALGADDVVAARTALDAVAADLSPGRTPRPAPAPPPPPAASSVQPSPSAPPGDPS